MSDSQNNENVNQPTAAGESQQAGVQQQVPQNQPATGPYGAAQPQQAQHFQQQAPCNQQQPQPPYANAPQSPYAAPPSPYAAYTGQPQPKKKWPWIVLACVLAFLLGLGGCVGCTTVSMVADSLHNRSDSIHSYDYDDLYGYGYDPDNLPDSDAYGGFTLSDIQDAAGNLPNEINDNQASAGVYVVGRDIDAGEYFMQGSASTESSFYVFSPEGSGTYSLETSVSYTGNYFVDLEQGQVIAFMPNVDNALLIPADEADFQPQAPYQSGLYRVGTDIPAGTYTVTVSTDAPHNPSQDYAAYVMKDLSFDDDSITDSVYLLRGSTQSITVNDGDWLELFGTTAAPQQ